MKKFKKFLNTAYGSYLKVLLTATLTLYLTEGMSIFHIDKKAIEMLGNAAIASLLPVFINALNSEDKRYGKKMEDLPKGPVI